MSILDIVIIVVNGIGCIVSVVLIVLALRGRITLRQGKGLKEWVHTFEDHIIVLSGPALATSGIIAGLDILTNSIIKTSFPALGQAMGMIWAVCLMLTLDFQVLTLGVRVRNVWQGANNRHMAWNVADTIVSVVIALALSFVSTQMGSIFAKMLSDPSLTLATAQQALGIDPNTLIYERSAMVLLLIFMSGWLRDEQSQASSANPAPQRAAAKQQSIAIAPIRFAEQKNIATMHCCLASMRRIQQDTAPATKITIEAQEATEHPALPRGQSQQKLVVLPSRAASKANEADDEGDRDTGDFVAQDVECAAIVARLSTLEALAHVEQDDIAKVLQAYLGGVQKSQIYLRLGWGSSKHTKIVKPVIEAYLSEIKEQQII